MTEKRIVSVERARSHGCEGSEYLLRSKTLQKKREGPDGWRKA
jgi:hypothetical protein